MALTKSKLYVIILTICFLAKKGGLNAQFRVERRTPVAWATEIRLSCPRTEA